MKTAFLIISLVISLVFVNFVEAQDVYTLPRSEAINECVKNISSYVKQSGHFVSQKNILGVCTCSNDYMDSVENLLTDADRRQMAITGEGPLWLKQQVKKKCYKYLN